MGFGPTPDVQARFELLEELLFILRGKTQVLTSSQATFVFQPGGSSVGNVYTTWPSLFAAASALQGPRWVQFNPTFAACTIPAGAWNFGPLWNTYFVSPSLAPITVAAGATLHGVADFDGVQLTYAGAGVCQTVGAGEVAVLRLFRAAFWSASGGGVFLNTTGTGNSNVLIFDESELLSGTCVEVTAGGATGILACDQSVISANTLAQSGGGSVLSVNRSSITAQIFLAQAGMPGGTINVVGTLVSPQATVNNDVVTQLPGNRSLVRSGQQADFTSPDGGAHVAFTILIAPGNPNAVHNFDLIVQGTNAGPDSFSLKINVTVQNANGVVLGLSGGIAPGTPSTTAGAAGWTAVATFSGANIIVTETDGVGGVKWSCTRQDVTGA